MDEIDERLTEASRNPRYHRAVRTAASQAKTTMNKYYGLTDAADAYRIAICESLAIVSVLVSASWSCANCKSCSASPLPQAQVYATAELAPDLAGRGPPYHVRYMGDNLRTGISWRAGGCHNENYCTLPFVCVLNAADMRTA